MVEKIKKTRSAGGVVVNTKGQILVVRQGFTSWSLPKGHIEDGENEMDAARREIYEESGIQNLQFIKKLGEYERSRLNKEGHEENSELKTILMFLFHTTEVQLQPIDPDNPQALWIDKKDVSKILTHAKDKEFFEKVFKDI